VNIEDTEAVVDSSSETNYSNKSADTETDLLDCDRDSELLLDCTTKPKKDTVVEYALKENEIIKARVLSVQPKSGKGKNWVNVSVVGDNKPKSSVNWDDIVWWREVSKGPEVVLLCSDVNQCKQEVVDAQFTELENLLENDVFEWVDDIGQSAISSSWVITQKPLPGNTYKTKARLVARGFEERLDKKVDSPTTSREALRFCVATAATMSWEIHSLDMHSAFLRGNPIVRDVYLIPPAEFAQEGKCGN